MPLVSTVDYPNKLIFLSADTLGISVSPVDIYREVRSLRRTTLDHRKFLPLISSRGNEPAGPSNTPILTILADGARIVPYDQSHTLTIGGTIVSIAENIAGPDLFDRSQLSPDVQVDVAYQPPQVEVIEVPTGGLTLEQSGVLTEIQGNVLEIKNLLTEIEPGHSHKDLMRLISAVLFGQLVGANTSTEIFKDITTAGKDRITSTVDEDGNRSSVVLDTSDV